MNTVDAFRDRSQPFEKGALAEIEELVAAAGLLGMEKTCFHALYVVIEDEVLNYRRKGLVISLGHRKHSKE